MRPLGWIIALGGIALFAAIVAVTPAAAADGWRAAFLLVVAPSVGAIVLLLVARVVGADWDATLMPLLSALPWLAFLALPMMAGQALYHWPAGHLHGWLSPPAFVARSAIALLFWTWLARALRRDTVRHAGPLLLAHGLVVSVMGYDWLLGTAPAQPNSAAPLMLAIMQIGGAAAFACACMLGTAAQRRDLAYLIVAAALGLAYLLYIDFAIVWFGDLPAHVGWYIARKTLPAALFPGIALLAGLFVPILLIGIGQSDTARRQAGIAFLVGLGLVACWLVAAPLGWWALLAALAGVAVAGGIARGLAA